MRRPPRHDCGLCGAHHAALRTRWGAPICGDCSDGLELRGWVERLAEPESDVGFDLAELATPEPACPDRTDTYVERLATLRPGRPDRAVAWVDREATRAWPNRRFRRALAQAGLPVTITSPGQRR